MNRGMVRSDCNDQACLCGFGTLLCRVRGIVGERGISSGAFLRACFHSAIRGSVHDKNVAACWSRVCWGIGTFLLVCRGN